MNVFNNLQINPKRTIIIVLNSQINPKICLERFLQGISRNPKNHEKKKAIHI